MAQGKSVSQAYLTLLNAPPFDLGHGLRVERRMGQGGLHGYLHLADLTGQTLATGLDLLGIQAPERI